MHAQEQPKQAGAAGRSPHPAARPATAMGLPPTTGMSAAGILALQRSVGNAAVARMVHEERHTHGEGCGHGQEPVQRSVTHEVLRSAGSDLDPALRTEMEGRYGRKLPPARIHTGPAAERAAAEMRARAFTSGGHIVFGRGAFDKPTLAHEMRHLEHQINGPVAGTDNGNGFMVSHPSDDFEKDAEASAVRAMRADPVQRAVEPAAPAIERTAGAGEPVIQRSPLPAPPPPPPPPPMRAAATTTATGPANQNAEDQEYRIPAEHTGIRSGPLSNGRLPLTNRLLVKQVLTKYYGVNRMDIAEHIKQRYAQVNGSEFRETPDMAALRNSHRPGYKDSDAYIAVGGGAERRGIPAHWPVVPDDAIKVHKGSLTAFHHGRPGQAFTGIVRFGGRDENGAPTEPKIILFPTQSTGAYLEQGVAEHEPENPANPPRILAESRVYDTKPTEYTTHAAAGRLSSHGKLSEHIQSKPKYADLAHEVDDDADLQSAGLTIGFTVIKGNGAAAHKYSFVSRSSNNHIFDLVSHKEKIDHEHNPRALLKLKAERSAAFGHLRLKANGEGSITREWGERVISSVNAAVSQEPADQQ